MSTKPIRHKPAVNRQYRKSRARWIVRAGLEDLEGRMLLDAGFGEFAPWSDPPFELGPGFPGLDIAARLTVTAISPQGGAVLRQSPGRIEVRFDRPIDEFSLGFDILLARMEPDGSTSFLFDELTAAFSEYDPADPSALYITLTSPLEPGLYQVSLAETCFVMATDGGQLDFSDLGRTLSAFSIEEPAATFSDALDLGTVGRAPIHKTDVLDLGTDATAVQLYRFVVTPEQPLWRVGIEVEAARRGSLLNSSLSLFDSGGRLMAVADLGRPDVPADPYLFVGLRPGTYYVGVSANGNRPDLPGGYDPLRGKRASVPSQSPGGEYTLRICADSAGFGTALIGFQLDRADRKDLAPTHIRLQFSAAITPPASREAAEVPALELRDQNGRSWPLHASSLDEKQALLELTIGRRLPPGRYSVVVPEHRGLTDLIGRMPYTTGLPDGVLATFMVGKDRASQASGDLGALYPDEHPDGIAQELVLDPGAQQEYRLVLLGGQSVRTTIATKGGPVRVEIVQPEQGSSHFFTVDPESVSNQFSFLKAGETLFRVVAMGEEPSVVSLRLLLDGSLFESLIQSGIGDGPALSLMQVAPSATSLGSSAPVSGLAIAPTSSTILGTTLPPGSGTSPIGSGTSSPAEQTATGQLAGGTIQGMTASATLWLALGAEPLGMPAAPGIVVSPAASPAGAALALTQGVGEGEGSGRGLDVPGGAGLDEVVAAWSGTMTAASDGAIIESVQSPVDGEGDAPTDAGAAFSRGLLVAAEQVQSIFAGLLKGSEAPTRQQPPTLPGQIPDALATMLVAMEGLPVQEEEASEKGPALAAFRPSIEMAFLAVVMIQFREKLAEKLKRIVGRSASAGRGESPGHDASPVG